MLKVTWKSKRPRCSNRSLLDVDGNEAGDVGGEIGMTPKVCTKWALQVES